MNLWLRLIWMLITLPWRPRVALLASSKLGMIVLPNDLDFNGHVNNGRYLTLADVARMDLMLRTGAARVAWRHRALPIVGDALAKFRRDLKPLQRFDVHSRVMGWEGKWVFMEHRFMAGGRVSGVVVVRGLLRGPQGNLDPQALAEALGEHGPSPSLPAWVLEWSQSCESLSQSLRDEE
ncbi:thioesterase family protein [Pseudomonas sp. nanlin1]|uniref:thioesterase family protein n=1 Tax=Pseudomonas sp. nanlin1 TaxID=3040605 RepID=UPI00388F7E31